MNRLREITVVACLVLTGCAPYIDDTYGRRSGTFGGKSVNGTAVLGEMFEQAGHQVYSWQWLSPKLDDADVIVWAPDDYQPPSDEVRRWLDQWLLNYSHGEDADWSEENRSRTLIYIGRDFDAVPHYWKKVQPGAPAGQRAEIGRRIVAAQSQENSERAELPKTSDNDWFSLDSTGKRRPIRTLSGPWSESIDPTKVEIELHTLVEPAEPQQDSANSSDSVDGGDEDNGSPIEPVESHDESEPDERSYDEDVDNQHMVDTELYEYDPPIDFEPQPTEVSTEVWLASGGDTLVSARYWADDYDEGTLIIVANGSFLLNLPLVNHEHRKLAGRLVDAVGAPGQKVVFVESHEGGPEILDRDPEPTMQTGLEVFGVWPINYVLLHAAVLGVIFCFARAPIFGLARDPRRPALADFGKHVAALGELLQKTKDRGYAASRVRQYQQVVLGETVSDNLVHDETQVENG